MAFPNSNLKQTAVYWPPRAADGFAKPTLGTPVEIKCRWEDVNEEFIDVSGANSVSTAQVFVDRDVLPGGVLWLGTLKTADDTALDNSGAHIIRRVDKIPTLKADAFSRKAYM